MSADEEWNTSEDSEAAVDEAHGNGMPRMAPAMRASGMTPAQAMRPKVMTHLLRTGSM